MPHWILSKVMNHGKWAGRDLNPRRQSQRIYSPPPLTTRTPTQEQFMFNDRTAAVNGSGETRTLNFQVKSPLLYRWVTDPYNVVIIQFSRFKGSRSPTDSYNIPSFWSLWGDWWTLRKLVQATKKGRKLLVSLPSICFYGLHLTYVFPYPQTGEYPQYANIGNQEY